MVVVVSAGQSGDSPMLPVLLDHLSVPRIGPGRPRTTPDRLRGDKAYSARGHRSLLRSRGITTTIPEPADQIANRKRRGSSGGRPPAFDPVDYKNRNHVERSFNHGKQWRGFATRYDKLGIVYRGAEVDPGFRTGGCLVRRPWEPSGWPVGPGGVRTVAG